MATTSPRDQGRRGDILAAALRCFVRVGYETATIGDICEESGASVGSIYHHFGNKLGVADALVVAGLADHLAALREPFVHADGVQDGITVLITELLGWVAANEDWARFIYLRTVAPAEQIDRALAEVNAAWSELVGSAWEQWVADGQVDPLPADAIPSVLLGPVHDLARRWLSGQVEGDLADLSPALAAAAWRSVARDW